MVFENMLLFSINGVSRRLNAIKNNIRTALLLSGARDNLTHVYQYARAFESSSFNIWRRVVARTAAGCRSIAVGETPAESKEM